MNLKKEIATTLCLSIFFTPILTEMCYADPQIEQVQQKKETKSEETSKTLSFKERLKARQEALKVSTIPVGEAYIPDGTQLNVEIINELTSKKARTGDYVQFKMLDNLILNDIVVVPVGAEVTGKVTKATSSGLFGRAGKLIFSIDKVRTINGVDIPLEYVGKIEAGSDGGAVAVVAVVSVIGGLFMKGANVKIPAGTKFAAKVAGDTDLKTSLTDLKESMNPEKPHGISITIK